MLRTTIHFGSRTQSVVALSSAESEFYTIGTGATEALHLNNFLGEKLHNKINLKVHTDRRQAKAWLHALACPSEPSTSSSNTCSYNTSFTTAYFPYTKLTPNTIQLTFLQNMCNEKCCNGTYMLRAFARQTKLQQFHTPAYEHKCAPVSAAYLIENIMYTIVDLKGFMVILVQLDMYMITSPFSRHHSP